MFPSANRPPRSPLLFFGGMLVFAVGIIGGFIFVALVGMDSPEFRKCFVSFIGMYMVGTALVLIGK